MEQVDAKKEPRDGSAALELARGSTRVLVAKGKKLLDFDMKKDAPEDEELQKAITGPTGNLRAPTLQVGKTLLVGFHEEAYATVFQ